MNLFERFRALLADRTGVSIEPDRDYLIPARLAVLQRAGGFDTLDDYIHRVIEGSDPALTRGALEAMMTGETFFFRDRSVFDAFQSSILPDVIRANQETRRLRIWCAAASTGQEPYSIAMTLDDMARQLRGWRIEIVATDISEAAVGVAREGSYNQFEVQRGLPVTLLLRYFAREQERWRIAEHLRAMIDFQTINLTRDFQRLGVFDVIFCRNVLMYFAPAAKQAVLARLGAALAPGGALILGATENVGSLAPELEADSRAPAIYRHRCATAQLAGVFAPARA